MLSLENLLKCIIFLGYSLVFLYLIISGKITKYINPKMNYYLIAASIIFFIMGLNYLKDILKKNHHKASLSVKRHLIYLIPLIIMFFLQPLSLNSTLAKNKSFTMVKKQANTIDDSIDSTDQENEDVSITDEPNSSYTDNNDINNEDSSYNDSNYIIYYDGEWVNIETLEELIMTEENYMKIMEPLFIEPQVLKGKPIEIAGFVLRNDDFDNNQLVVARGLITCCIADSSIVGVMAEGDELEQYNDNQWVWVRGKVDVHEYHGEVIPIIIVEEVKGISVPEQEYIYP